MSSLILVSPSQCVTSCNTHKSLLMYFQAEVPSPAFPCPSWIHSGTSGTSGISRTTWTKASPCSLTLLYHSYYAYCSFCSFCLSYVPSHTASQVPSKFCISGSGSTGTTRDTDRGSRECECTLHNDCSASLRQHFFKHILCLQCFSNLRMPTRNFLHFHAAERKFCSSMGTSHRDKIDSWYFFSFQ